MWFITPTTVFHVQLLNYLWWCDTCVSEAETEKYHRKWRSNQGDISLCVKTWHDCSTDVGCMNLQSGLKRNQPHACFFIPACVSFLEILLVLLHFVLQKSQNISGLWTWSCSLSRNMLYFMEVCTHREKLKNIRQAIDGPVREWIKNEEEKKSWKLYWTVSLCWEQSENLPCWTLSTSSMANQSVRSTPLLSPRCHFKHSAH